MRVSVGSDGGVDDDDTTSVRFIGNGHEDDSRTPTLATTLTPGSIYVNVQIYIRIHEYMCVCMHECIYIYIYIYMSI